MAELVGGALLSGFINVLFERLASKEVLSLFQGNKAISKLLKELEIKLRSANKLLNDAEVKQLTDEDVKKWLDDVKEVVYEADHVMDKINNEALQRKVEEDEQSGSIARRLFKVLPNLYSADNTIKSEIEEILVTLDLLLGCKDGLGLREGVHQNRLQRPGAPLADACDVYGRDAEKEAIVNLLLSEQKLSVIPIVGMGGIGKTTLAQLVYNDSRVQDHFSLKVWVTVSEEFDVFKLTRMIIEAITSKKCDIQDLYQLQNALKNEVKGKRFLFVLDDVWNENYELWDGLNSSFNSGAYGSKILVTTRNATVALNMGAQPYTLQMMQDDDCWKLFARHAFHNIGSGVPPFLQEMGKEIVKKCKGLPLAIKSIAGVLRSLSSSEEWRGILRSDVWDLQFQENQKNKILPALWLSYQFLPPNLKRCFAYCSIFPKDYEFRKGDKETIVLLWMAEGLLQPEKGKSMEDVGKSYLDVLISRSFFQRSSVYGIPILLMHDLVHDLAMRVSSEFCFTLDGCDHLDGFTSKTRHLSYQKDNEDITKLQGLSKTKCLRTLLALPLTHVFISSRSTSHIPCELFQGVGGCLKVLSLSQSSIIKLHDSIGDLKYLRYLDLSMTKVEEIPSSVCTLYNLQTLLLTWCEKLTQLPTNTCSLINLRHLGIKGTSLKEMPPQMCKLKNLQTLSDFVLGENGGSRIKELGELKSLQGSLRISGLENVVHVGDVLQADLKNKECLTELCLEWEPDSICNDSTKEKEVLTALEPHKMLKILKINGYRGTMFPDWVACESFSDMVEVTLCECKNCYLLPPLGQLPSLKRLEFLHMDGLESIGDEFCGTPSTTPFPSLETLDIAAMGSLERWSFTGAEQEGEIFPRLNNLFIAACDKLNVGLPAGCFPSLETIHIRYCKEMVSAIPTSQAEIDSAYPSLKSICLVACPRLELFSGMEFPSNLKELDIFKCRMLIANRMNWDLQRLSSLQSLMLTGFEIEGGVDSFPEEGLLPSTLTSLTIIDFENLKTLNGKSFHNLTSLQKLVIGSCGELQCLPEEELPPSLAFLGIDNSPLLKQRCQRGTGEDWHKIQHIPNIIIDRKEI